MDVAYAIDPEVRVKVMAFDGNVSTAIRSLGMRPAELVKGDEYSGKDIPGSELCDTVTLYPMVEGHSTSRLVGR
jgi:bifunctional ADP-heptose synthase (sugar kinase/adenylyltransferase)